MADAGPLFCGTGANFNDGGTTAWTNPTNVQGDTTGTAATCAPGGTNGNTSQRLRATNFGFDIPTSATVDGITVEVEAGSANNSRNSWSSVQLLIAGSESGSDLSDGSNINAKGFKTFGSGSELWGLTPTPAQVNASGFGASFKIVRSNNATTTSLFRARVTVTYTEAPTDANADAEHASATGAASGGSEALEITAEALVSAAEAFDADVDAEGEETVQTIVYAWPAYGIGHI